jgi:hypothetical protein
MCITREAAHIFASTASGQSERRRRGVLRMHDTYFNDVHDSPFGALRAAQLQALGIDARDTPLVLFHLLPLGLFADADEERLLLDAVCFLVTHRVFSRDARPSGAAAAASGVLQPELNDTQAKIRVMNDLSFSLDAQLQAAEARGQPLRNAFSFSGRTLASVTRLAAQHRREAAVASMIAGMRGASPHDVPRLIRMRRCEISSPYGDVCGFCRANMDGWDDECERMLALLTGDDEDEDGEEDDDYDDGAFYDDYNDDGDVDWECDCGGAYLLDADLRWSAEEHFTGIRRASIRHGITADATLHGDWCMQRLCTLRDVRDEGAEQHNCLRRANVGENSPVGFSDEDASYWSLRFTPDAAGQQEMAGNFKLWRNVNRLRLTVHVSSLNDDDAFVRHAEAARHQPPPLAALAALAAWGRRVGVRVPQYTGDSSDGAMDDEDIL